MVLSRQGSGSHKAVEHTRQWADCLGPIRAVGQRVSTAVPLWLLARLLSARAFLRQWHRAPIDRAMTDVEVITPQQSIRQHTDYLPIMMARITPGCAHIRRPSPTASTTPMARPGRLPGHASRCWPRAGLAGQRRCRSRHCLCLRCVCSTAVCGSAFPCGDAAEDTAFAFAACVRLPFVSLPFLAAMQRKTLPLPSLCVFDCRLWLRTLKTFPCGDAAAV